MMLMMNSADASLQARAGHTLAGRYRLLHPLGAGSGGRAYVATDTQLGRRVAVKVLHEGLATDPGFLERFRAEARAVASLSHPNIVTLHDWGADPVPFMVLELLQGGSLAGMLRAGNRLTAAQTAHLGEQVVAGLEHAHERGLIHRDVKPANLLFDDRGAVKIADFGLARALAESGATEPVEGVVGTARYLAPEQATGEPVDGRADLYALALVLVESVVGDVPLRGDGPLATLSLRAATPIEAPVELGALGVVVERAGLPSPLERYADAAAMGRALVAAMGMLPEAEPFPLSGLGIDLSDPEPTEVVMARPGVVAGQATAEIAGEPKREPEPEAAEVAQAAEPERRRRRWAIPSIVGLAAGAALIAAAWALGQVGGPVVHAPNVVGATEAAAGAALAGAGLSLDVDERVYSADPPGTVLRQSPSPGGGVRRGRGIGVVVSRGAPPVDLPAVTGTQEEAAGATLEAAGFEVAVEHRFDAAAPAGTVILQEPSSKRAPEGSSVTIVVSRGPEPVVLTNIIGRTVDEAEAALEELGFNVLRTEEFSDAVEKARVIRQDPVAGAEAVPGSEVTIIVSKGPDRVTIPEVRGLTVEDATSKIEAAGLEVDVVGYKPGGKVKSQDPEGGLMLERGRTITLFV